MYKSLKSVLKNKSKNSVLLKILGLKDYDSFRSFLLRLTNRKYKDTIEAIGFQQLIKYNIKQGELLFVSEQFTLPMRDWDTGTSKNILLSKNYFLTLISFTILKDKDQTIIPNIGMWFTVLYKDRIYHLDAGQFLNYIDIGYIKCCDLSG